MAIFLAAEKCSERNGMVKRQLINARRAQHSAANELTHPNNISCAHRGNELAALPESARNSKPILKEARPFFLLIEMKQH